MSLALMTYPVYGWTFCKIRHTPLSVFLNSLILDLFRLLDFLDYSWWRAEWSGERLQFPFMLVALLDRCLCMEAACSPQIKNRVLIFTTICQLSAEFWEDMRLRPVTRRVLQVTKTT